LALAVKSEGRVVRERDMTGGKEKEGIERERNGRGRKRKEREEGRGKKGLHFTHCKKLLRASMHRTFIQFSNTENERSKPGFVQGKTKMINIINFKV